MELNLKSTRLEIPTNLVFKETEITSFLNENSERIINKIGESVTTWMFEADQGIHVFAKFQELSKGKEISWRFLSNLDDSLIFERL